MMSVTPGTGSGTKEESTMETRKMPMSAEAEEEVDELALMVGRGEPHGGGVEWQQRRGVGGHHGRRDARGGPEVAQR